MNTRHLLSLLVIAVLTLVPSVLLTGCESQDSPNTDNLDTYFRDHPYVSDPRGETTPRIVSIKPDSVDISFVGQQVTFTAVGGEGDYAWDTADHAHGTITATPNNGSAVYTATIVGPNNVIVYDANGRAAVASINGPTTPLLAVANPDTLAADGDLSVLTASGGVPPYNWSVGNIALGNVNSPTGVSVVYKRAHKPDNSVTVTDATGNSFTLVIAQPPP